MNHHAQTSIEIFTTPTCPDCLELKRWLDARGLTYLERDLRDPAIAEVAKVRTGLRIAPITLIGGQNFYGPFGDQLKGIENALGLNCGN